MENTCFRSAALGRSTKKSSSKRPLRISSGGSTVTLLQVAATKTAGLRSCIQERNDANKRDETPASAEAESGSLSDKTFSHSSVHKTPCAEPSATRNTFLL